MLRVAICDGKQSTHCAVEQLLQIYGKTVHQDIKFIHFYSAEELFQAGDKFDVLLLDMEMPQMDGIEIARELNARDIDYKIIILSGSSNRFKEAFQVGAFRFLTRPIQREELFEAVDGVQKQMISCQEVTVYRDGVSYHLQQKEIMYVMADNDETRIFTEKNDFRGHISLKKLMLQLDGQLFFGCHRGYIVNLSKIKEVGKNMIFMVTGEKIPVSRRNRAEFQRVWSEFEEQEGRRLR